MKSEGWSGTTGDFHFQYSGVYTTGRRLPLPGVGAGRNDERCGGLRSLKPMPCAPSAVWERTRRLPGPAPLHPDREEKLHPALQCVKLSNGTEMRIHPRLGSELATIRGAPCFAPAPEARAMADGGCLRWYVLYSRQCAIPDPGPLDRPADRTGFPGRVARPERHGVPEINAPHECARTCAPAIPNSRRASETSLRRSQCSTRCASLLDSRGACRFSVVAATSQCVSHLPWMRLKRFVRCAPIAAAALIAACSDSASTASDHGIPDLDGIPTRMETTRIARP